MTSRRATIAFLLGSSLALAGPPAFAQMAGGAAPALSSSGQTGSVTGSSGASSAASQQSAAQSSSAASSGPAQGSFSGSVPAELVPGVLQLSLSDAIRRGLRQNLGALLSSSDVETARGERWRQLSALLPHVSAAPYVDVSQVNLKEFGFSFNFPGVSIPAVVGPFSYFDARASLSQSLFDWSAMNNARASKQQVASAQSSYQDARDLVVLASGYSYLQVTAAEATVETAQAQVNSAQALYDQATSQVQAGTSPSIDGLRAHVELQTEQQQLIAAKNNYEIAKLALARVIGLAPGQQFDITDKSMYQPFPGMSVDEALKRAYASRSDLQAAAADMRAAEYQKKAAEAEHYPTLSFSSDYGIAGQHISSNHGVFDVRGTLNIPIFEGNAAHGDILQADARLNESRERYDNLRGQIDSDVRTALLNVESAQQQVDVARSNVDLADQTLSQARDRFAAGVTDTVEVVQAEEQVASAHQNYISSLYQFNYAKISLARALGLAEEGFKEYFKGN